MKQWGTCMLQYKKPIFETRKDTQLASDRIRPYGERINVYSEIKRKAFRLKLLGIRKENAD